MWESLFFGRLSTKSLWYFYKLRGDCLLSGNRQCSKHFRGQQGGFEEWHCHRRNGDHARWRHYRHYGKRNMFFYSRSEISSITAPRDSNVSRVESSSTSLSFREYKRAAKAAWRDVKTTEFWGDNTTSMDYYHGYRTRKRLSTIFCCSGAAVTFAGIIFPLKNCFFLMWRA